MLPVYFLVINKSNQSTPAPAITLTPTQYIPEKHPPNQLGFITINTSNGVDEPKKFLPNYEKLIEQKSLESDNSTPYTSESIQSKWIYDKNNEYSIERTILNKNNAYSNEELSALGKTTKPNTYLVNQIIFLYDKNNTSLTKNTISMVIKPMSLTTYANFQKMVK
jgi:hypothetical protein